MRQKKLKRQPSALLRLGDLLVLLAVLAVSLSACTRGPKVERCIIDGDPQRLAMDCFDPRINAPEGYSRTIESAENYICSSAFDEQRLLKACAERRGTLVTFCIVSPEDRGGWCASSSDPIVPDMFKTWEQMMNFVCTSPQDFEVLLKWCTR